MSNEQLLQKFIDKQLSPEERKVFDARYQADSDFAQSVKKALHLLALARAAATSKELAEVGDEMEIQALQKRLFPEKKALPFYRSRTFQVAAAVVILLLIGIGYFYPSSNPSAALANQYYQNPHHSLEKVGDIWVSEDSTLIKKEILYKKSVKSFDNQDYTKAIADFESLKSQGDIPELVYLYLGISYYEKGNYEKAAAEFQLLSENASDHNRRIAAKWYQSLAYLHLKQTEKAKKSLLEVVDFQGESPYISKAKELLTKLNK